MVVAKPRKVAGQTCKSAADASEALQAGRQAGRQPSKQRQAAEKHRDGLGRHAVIQKAYKN